MLTALGSLIAVGGAHAADAATAAQRMAATAAGASSPHSAAHSKESALKLKSSAVLVVDQDEGEELYAKNTDAIVPIASITKLMTAMVVLDRRLPLDEPVKIAKDDVDDVKGTQSRLRVGSIVTRGDLLRLSLMSSENRAAAALTRAYPGGRSAFVTAMNEKATRIGMRRSRFVDGTGLSRENVSTAKDLAKLVHAAYGYPEIREYTTDAAYTVRLGSGRTLRYANSNRLVRSPTWHIGLSKTGYINEAGRCLVMQAVIATQPVIIVLLDSWGKLTRIGDANRIKKWMEGNGEQLRAARPET